MRDPHPADAIAEAVELATIIANLTVLGGPRVGRAACVHALRVNPVKALAGQAALCGTVARLASAHVDKLLRDPLVLAAALAAAKAGKPLTSEAIGVSRDALFREAGMAAAKMSS